MFISYAFAGDFLNFNDAGMRPVEFDRVDQTPCAKDCFEKVREHRGTYGIGAFGMIEMPRFS
jgi:hypothetical protein